MATLNDFRVVNGRLEDAGTSDLIFGTSDGDWITIHSGDDLVQAYDGNDYIIDHTGVNGQGASGADRIYCGTGDDVIVSTLDGAGNVYIGDDGIDLLNLVPMQAGVIVDLAQGIVQNRSTADTSKVITIENVVGTAFRDQLSGDDKANTLTGYANDDIIRGQGGNDRLEGDDGYDVLFGGTENDSIYGGDQNDVLYGEAGSDYLSGDNGTDLISGGLGRDFLGGGLGADIFEFRSLTHSSASAGAADSILDFQHLIDDIDVSRIDANALVSGNQAFVFKGPQAFSGAGQIRTVYDQASDDTVVLFNTDSDRAAEMAIRIDGMVTLTKGDFIL